MLRLLARGPLSALNLIVSECLYTKVPFVALCATSLCCVCRRLLLKTTALPTHSRAHLAATYRVSPSNQWISRASHQTRAGTGAVRATATRNGPVLHDSMPLLKGQVDPFNGVIIDPDALPSSTADFSSSLAHSLEAWRSERRRGIWLKVKLASIALMQPAIQSGFQIHHAEKDYVMLNLWLPESTNQLPANASHQVGIGAFVLNEAQEVLVVQERRGPLRGKGIWKMVTGLIDAGEDLPLGAAREVKEETGVTAQPDSILAIRQAHGFAFGKSDLFFLVALRAAAGQAQLQPQAAEVAEAAWMPLKEYANLDFLRRMPLHSAMLDRCVAWAEGRYQGLHPRTFPSGRLEGGIDELLLAGDVQESAKY